MKTTVGNVRHIIAEALMNEFGPIKGKLRPVRGPGGRKHKIGKIEDENTELSAVQVERLFPGAVDAWVEVVPDMFPDYPFKDNPQAIKTRSLWFKIGPQLRVAFAEMPQIELASWDEQRDDWFPIDEPAQ